MFTTVMLWICIVNSILCGISCFIGTFTKKTVNERLAHFLAFTYYIAVTYFLIGLI